MADFSEKEFQVARVREFAETKVKTLVRLFSFKN